MGGAARRRPSTIPAPARVVVAGIVPPSEPGARRRVVHRRARTPSRVTGARRGHRPSPGRRASPWSPASPLANRTPESMAAGARPGRRRPFRPPEANSSGLSAASPGGCSVDRRLLFAESDTRRPGATRHAQERHWTLGQPPIGRRNPGQWKSSCQRASRQTCLRPWPKRPAPNVTVRQIGLGAAGGSRRRRHARIGSASSTPMTADPNASRRNRDGEPGS